VAFAFVFLVVIPEGDLLLPLFFAFALESRPYPRHPRSNSIISLAMDG
jgi:hypothetical protein